jgi:hypothetical protein
VAYFSFLFADRFAVGTAITLFSGLSFGIESGYARGIDFALVNFLFTAALDLGRLYYSQITINNADTRWATLYFQKPDKSIVVVGLDRTTWKVWTEPHVYARN